MNWLKAHIIEDWNQALKWSSIRFNAFLLLLSGMFQIMPTLDPSIAGILPTRLQSAAIGGYALIGLFLRLTKLKGNG